MVFNWGSQESEEDTKQYPVVTEPVIVDAEVECNCDGMCDHIVEEFGDADLVQVVICRLEKLQAGPERCGAYGQAISYLKDAREVLEAKLG